LWYIKDQSCPKKDADWETLTPRSYPSIASENALTSNPANAEAIFHERRPKDPMFVVIIVVVVIVRSFAKKSNKQAVKQGHGGFSGVHQLS
jgi:hypothetical protein